MSNGPGFRTTIRVRDVSRQFFAGAGNCSAGVTALSGASVEIRGGEILVVGGPRGAGKTTLLLCVAGMLHFDAGDILGRAGRVVYRDLAHPSPMIAGWPALGAILLDSCDDLGLPVRAQVATAIECALGSGSAIVLAARDPECALSLAPSSATISIVHLRLGKVLGQRTDAGVANRVAEAVGGGY